MIDVRTQREVEIYGEVPGTHFRWDFYEDGFAEKILSLDRETTYLVYCWHANRTAYLMEFMRQSGFREVYDLEGGIDHYNETKK
jgi:rhodanese-related sulfurtransferase